jgi:hypothetical protein
MLNISNLSDSDIENNLQENEETFPTNMMLTVKMESDIFRRRFPTLSVLEYEKYLKFQKKHLDILPVTFLAAINLFSFFVRSDISRSLNSGPIFISALGFLLLGTVIFSMFCGAHLIVFYVKKESRYGFYYRISERCLLRWFNGKIEDYLAIIGTYVIGLYLVGRVVAGQCPAGVTLTEIQRCNPVAVKGFIPFEEIFLLYTLPIIAQIVLRAVTISAILFCWISVMGFMIFSFFYVSGWDHYWILIYSAIAMNISYEFEVLTRVNYVRNLALISEEESKIETLKRTQQTEKDLIIMRSQYEIDRVQALSENERILKLKEIDMLRSLMGNVAHDLKTPLYSIEADVDVLHTFFKNLSPKLIADVVNKVSKNSSIVNFDHDSIFGSLMATCKFMVMAINRSQDYVKASHNIDLLPTMETFELKVCNYQYNILHDAISIVIISIVIIVIFIATNETYNTA